MTTRERLERNLEQKQHTPGPWHVGQMNGEGSIFAAEGRMRYGNDGTMLYPICNVIDYNGDQAANARLIAAAPELLDLLKECTKRISHYATMPHALPESHKLAADIRAAIAKAQA